MAGSATPIMRRSLYTAGMRSSPNTEGQSKAMRNVAFLD